MMMLNFRVVTIRVFFVLFLLIFVVACVHKSTTYPQWFDKREVSKTDQYMIVGFGNGKSKQEAKDNALREISQEIELRVSSISNSKKTYTSSSFDIKTRISSSSNLSGAKLLKDSHLDGIYFVF
jgi:Na+-transporting methylmalonyl-CoA/oxaloacetate decarboxylase gamma subunit